MSEPMVKVLVVDDTPANVKIIKRFIEPKGYRVVVANNGQEAIDLYKSEKPEIVIMDVMMPVVDGYEATKAIREWDDDHWVPLIFLSAKTTIDDKVKALQMGGDDYLTKPVDLRLLEAKLSAMMRIVTMQRELKATSTELQNYVKLASAEMDLAERLMDNMLNAFADEGNENVKRFNVAAKVISGDISVVYKAKSANKLYILLADGTGHGLSAAISLIPATQLFYSLAQKETPISNIATSINTQLRTLLTRDRFVAATIAIVDEDEQTVEIWNGSNPPPIIVDENGNLLKIFERTNFALGVVNDQVFTSDTESFHYTQNCELLLYSDGLTELRKDNGEIIGVEGLIKYLEMDSGEGDDKQCAFDRILQHVEAYKVEDSYGDDVSLISIASQIN